jgi:dTDP-4-amino-4,6-dideoxygalactose transaminase
MSLETLPGGTTAVRLAIDGGSPVRTAPLPQRIVVDDDVKQAALAVLDPEMRQGGGFDRYGGSEVDAYEQEFAAYFGARFATSTSSGTAAIHTALAALRPEPGGEVINSPVTDPGGVMPIVWMNLVPIFADVDPDTFNMDPRSVAARVTDRTRAIIVTHLAGQPADLDPILETARARNIPVIEDCAQAQDALYKGRKVGSIGTLGAFSLMGGKHSTAGGQGGMVLTNGEGLYWNAKRFADRGKPFNSDERKNVLLGMNYRMTELGAAIGRVTLRKLPRIVRRRRELAGLLQERLRDLQAIHLGKVIDGATPAYWFLFLKVDALRLRVGHDQVAAAIAAEGIPVQARYDHLVYEAPWLRDRITFGTSGWPWSLTPEGRAIDYDGSCPNARRAIDSHLLLTFHEGYTERDVEDIALALRKVELAYLQ